MPAAIPNRKIVIAAAGLLLATALVFFHARAHRQSFHQLSHRQQTLTVQAAAAMEEHLQATQKTLRHLSDDGPDLLRERDAAAGRLEVVFHSLPPKAGLAAYLKDAEGTIVAQPPPASWSVRDSRPTSWRDSPPDPRRR